jgi:hypothetical protein
MDYDVILIEMLALGRHLWLCLALALGLALGAQAAMAKECHYETPLPADVRLSALSLKVPEAVARFAGAGLLRRSSACGLLLPCVSGKPLACAVGASHCVARGASRAPSTVRQPSTA